MTNTDPLEAIDNAVDALDQNQLPHPDGELLNMTFGEWLEAWDSLGENWHLVDQLPEDPNQLCWEELQFHEADENEDGSMSYGEVNFQNGVLRVLDVVVYDPAVHTNGSVADYASAFVDTVAHSGANEELVMHFMNVGVL